MSSLVLIERISESCDCWSNLQRNKKIQDLSVDKIINKYQGFEGDLVDFYKIEEDEGNIKEIIENFLELKNYSNCLMLYINTNEINNYLLNNQILEVGYDVGVCEEEKTIYSSIFNEILFGNILELVAYKDFLNEHFLFQDKSLAEKYVQLHDEMSLKGKDVEDYEEMTIYKIWKFKDAEPLSHDYSR